MPMDPSNPTGYGAKNKSPVPTSTRKYSPHSGGYQGDDVEAKGMPGDKGEAMTGNPTGNREEGNYNHEKIRAFGNYPHSAADPEITGPPIGTDSGTNPNGDVNQ